MTECSKNLNYSLLEIQAVVLLKKHTKKTHQPPPLSLPLKKKQDKKNMKFILFKNKN